MYTEKEMAERLLRIYTRQQGNNLDRMLGLASEVSGEPLGRIKNYYNTLSRVSEETGIRKGSLTFAALTIALATEISEQRLAEHFETHGTIPIEGRS